MNVTEIKQAQLANAIDPSKPMTKVLQVLTLAAEPSEKQVDMIKPYLLRDFSPDELYIRQMELANDQVDRSFERFDRGYLKRFAETIIGKSVLTGHEYGNAPVGRFFDATVARGANGWQWVMPWFYMPKSPGNQLARDNIDSGVWSYVSIGAYVDYAGLTCDICGRPYYYWMAGEASEKEPDLSDVCRHVAGQEYDGEICTVTYTAKKSDMTKVEAVEGSIVYLGCQYDAAIAKSAESVSARRLFKETLLGNYAEPERVTAEACEGDNKEVYTVDIIDRLKRLSEVDSDDPDVLLTEIERRIGETNAIRADAGDGAKLRAWMVGEVGRLADCVGNAAARRLAEKCETVEELLELRAELDREWSEKRSPRPQADAETPDNAATTRPTDTRAYCAF